MERAGLVTNQEAYDPDNLFRINQNIRPEKPSR
jgi:hypothetical protein